MHAQLKPSRKNASGDVRNGNSINASTSMAISHPVGGNAGRKRKASNPSASANIPVFMNPPFQVIHSVLDESPGRPMMFCHKV